MKGKDLIHIGIFSAIYFVIVFIVAMLGFIPIFLPLLAVIVPILGGIPFMLFLTRVKKFGMIWIMSVIMGLMMLLTGLPVTALQWFSVIFWIVKGIWWPFVLWVLVAVIWGTLVSRYYFDHVKYICPECHEVFKPTFREAFWANHTPAARRLTCTSCGRKGFCVEIWGGEDT